MLKHTEGINILLLIELFHLNLFYDLFHQIRLEFGRITTVQLEPTFYSTLDKFTPKLLELLKGKDGQKGKQIQSILATLEKVGSLSMQYVKTFNCLLHGFL